MPSATPQQRADGTLRFTHKALEHIVTSAIASVPGTEAIDAKLAGLAGRAFPRLLIQSDPASEVLAVDASIAVTWPSPVTDVAKSTRKAIEEWVAAYTGYRTTRVNVTVAAAVPGERVSGPAVDARQTPRAITPRSLPERQLKPITTNHTVPIRNIDAPAPQPVRSIDADSAPLQVASVRAPEPTRLLQVTAPTPNHVRPVTAPNPVAVRSVAVPRPLQPRPVSAPRPVALRTVRVPEPAPVRQASLQGTAPVRHVVAPRPQPLREITINPMYRGSQDG